MIDRAKAQELNDWLAVHPDIPWAANSNNCHVKREYAIGLLLSQKGVPLEALGRITVAFERPTDYFHKDNLLADKNASDGWTDWTRVKGDGSRYHTAMTIDVTDAAHNHVQTLVIDPSIDPLQPMTVEDFVARTTTMSKSGQVFMYKSHIGEALQDAHFEECDVTAIQKHTKLPETRREPPNRYILPKVSDTPFIEELKWYARVEPDRCYKSSKSTAMDFGHYADVPSHQDWAGKSPAEIEQRTALLYGELEMRYNIALPEMRRIGLIGKSYVEKYRAYANEANSVQI